MQVIIDAVFGKLGEAPLRFFFTGGPQLPQRLSGLGKSVEARWDRVAGDLRHSLFRNSAGHGRHAMLQTLEAGTLELAEHLKILAGLGQHGAGAEQQLIKVTMHADVAAAQQGLCVLIA